MRYIYIDNKEIGEDEMQFNIVIICITILLFFILFSLISLLPLFSFFELELELTT